MNSPATHNMYFIAIVCPPELNEKILKYKLWVKEHFGSKVALKSPAHITLVQPFWFEGSREEKLKQTFFEFTSDLEQLEIQLDGFSYFDKRVLFVKVLENDSLEKLKYMVENHFVNFYGGLIKKDKRPFHPHITIANRDLKPGDFNKALLYFSKKTFNEKFLAKTISLLKLIDGKWNVMEERNWN